MIVDSVKPIAGGALAAAGVTAIGRYITKQHGSAIVTGISAAEVADLSTHGIGLFWIYEDSSATWMSGGYAAGVQAGQWIQSQLAALGASPETIYLAADATTLSTAAVNACLDGAVSVLGAARVSLYGFLPQLTAARGHASLFWLCGTYTNPGWINLYQANGSQPSGPTSTTIAGQPCDVDYPLTADFGASTVNWTDQIPFPTASNPTGTASVEQILANADLYAGEALTNTKALVTAVASLAAQVTALQTAVAALQPGSLTGSATVNVTLAPAA